MKLNSSIRDTGYASPQSIKVPYSVSCSETKSMPCLVPCAAPCSVPYNVSYFALLFRDLFH